ncbi:ATPase [Weizmannia acidilactici]|uniref:ATP-binding protein n=1 Tax=Weizmannia acidilactici TaxID=2607726 RepID=UPI00124C130B|nr:sensor histidine kinase [Weizmannia acidilactici]GER66692.1 ATPase [Weizmannia acidilactici]
MRRIRVSLQTKILGLVLLMSFFIIGTLASYFMIMESRQIEAQDGRLALEIAKTVATMPTLIDAFQSKNPAETIQPLAEKIRMQTGAEFIVVGNREGIRYSHPLKNRIGKKMVGGDNERAILKGESYISKANGSLGPSLRGKTPIRDRNGKIIGVVSVGFMLRDIHEQMDNRAKEAGGVALLSFLAAVLGSALLARDIRKDTMGLEPYEIAALYKEKRAILHAVKEGIIAVDRAGFVTTMNQPAKNLLHIGGSVRRMKVDELVPASFFYEVMESKRPKMDREMVWKGRTLIVNSTPILDEHGEVQGAVASFRDRSEIERMVNTLSEVRKYSEDLRAQSHEYANKLHVISGLLQLGAYEDAVEFIRAESASLQNQHARVFQNIKDSKVQAVLLGKLGRASEKKIHFDIDPNSSLQSLPKYIDLSRLIVIIGNLLDNAFEAAAKAQNPTVLFFATDLGSDIVFEISDNGTGIEQTMLGRIFERGFTTKTGEAARGFGLSNVDHAVSELGGFIEVHSNPGEGSVFTVYLPKGEE